MHVNDGAGFGQCALHLVPTGAFPVIFELKQDCPYLDAPVDRPSAAGFFGGGAVSGSYSLNMALA